MQTTRVIRIARRLVIGLRQLYGVTIAWVPGRIRHPGGQTTTEYAILLGVIALVVVVVAVTLGSSIAAVFTSASRHL